MTDTASRRLMRMNALATAERIRHLEYVHRNDEEYPITADVSADLLVMADLDLAAITGRSFWIRDYDLAVAEVAP